MQVKALNLTLLPLPSRVPGLQAYITFPIYGREWLGSLFLLGGGGGLFFV